MKTTEFRLGLVLRLIVFGSARLRADVTITPPIGGNTVRADNALTSTNGAAFPAPGNIVNAEGAATGPRCRNWSVMDLHSADGRSS
jgi:hypothetical protein